MNSNGSTSKPERRGVPPWAFLLYAVLVAVAAIGATKFVGQQHVAPAVQKPAVARRDVASQAPKEPEKESRLILAYETLMVPITRRSIACARSLMDSINACHVDPGVLTDIAWKRGVAEDVAEINSLVKEAGEVQVPPVCQKLHENTLDTFARMQTMLNLLQQAADNNDLSKCAQAEADFTGLTAVQDAGLGEERGLVEVLQVDQKKENDEDRKARGEAPEDGTNKFNDDPPIKDRGDSMYGVTPVAKKRVRTSTKPGWYLVEEWSRPGDTLSYTNLFTITEKKWRIKWDCGADGRLLFTLRHGSSETKNLADCYHTATGGVIEETVQGDSYLLLIADGTWHVRVEEYQE
jgi:hypothetical protein